MINDFYIAHSNEFKVLFEMFIAAFLGATIGWDREKKNRPAGLKTHILVAASAAMFVGVGFSFPENVASDPLRIMGALITGISFLGAGTIFKSKEGGVEGITTAASLLFTGAIGLATGLERYILAVGSTVFGLIVLQVIGMGGTTASKKE